MAHHTVNTDISLRTGDVPKEPSPWPQASARQTYLEGKEIDKITDDSEDKLRAY